MPTQTAVSDALQSLRVLSQDVRPKTWDNGKSLAVRSDGDILITDVPFARQGRDNTCGQAAMAMLLHYWDIDVDYDQIAREGNPLNVATSRQAIQLYLQDKGLQVRPLQGSLESLLGELHQARPVLLLLDFGGIDHLHYVVAVGYNARQGRILIHDSNREPYKQMSISEFLQRWQNFSAVALPWLGGPEYERLMFAVSPGGAS
ncbi:MAG: cysteine peptidase family C39 domain-containing protein [Candidatus Sericytochromatia bacterium]